MATFLPDDYTPPKSNNGYMKIEAGENKFRILSAPILGWEDWDNKKPIRFRYEEKPQKSIDPKMPIKHFWSFIVWNYATEQIQILHVTQATIRNKLQSLSQDKDWGDPYFYDIKIIKSGEGKETEYDLNPLPHKDLHPQVEEAFNEKPCCLEALFNNVDPFSKEHKYPTPGVFKKVDAPKDAPKKPTSREIDDLCSILAACSQEFQDSIKKRLEDKKTTLSSLDVTDYIRLLTTAKQKRDEFALQISENVPF